MRVPLALAVVCAFLLTVVSCKKSAQPPASNAVTGTWNFVSVNLQSEVLAVEAGDTSISYPTYTTAHNSGTFTFTIDSLAVNGLAYSVDTSFNTFFYLNGHIVDTVATPITGSVPPTSLSSSYKMVSQDSLYIVNGGLFPTTGTLLSSAGQGLDFTVTGDTLRLVSKMSDTTAGLIQTGKVTITLTKQH